MGGGQCAGEKKKENKNKQERIPYTKNYSLAFEHSALELKPSLKIENTHQTDRSTEYWTNPSTKV